MRKHTTIDLDAHLVGEAKAVLGTRTTSETVHAALAEVVRARRRLGILELRPALTLDDLAAMRDHRFAEDHAPYGSGVDAALEPGDGPEGTVDAERATESREGPG
jgi:Arc/MetJ family transcription regulator